MEKLVEDLVRIRLWQLAVNKMILEGGFKVPIHLALGHEAIAAAVYHAFKEGDKLCLTHRNIHYNLAFSNDLQQEIDELKLKSTGISSGKMGSMNMTNVEKGLIYTSSILGNNLPVACGVALAEKHGNSGITFVVTGDGALEEGAFYESLLLASSLRLPIVFIIENNNWSMFTKIEQRRSVIKLEKMASSLGISYMHLNGSDVVVYEKGVRTARENVSAGIGPVLIEVDVTTLGGWLTDEGESARFINYHHGGAAKITTDICGIIEDEPTDPLSVIRHKYVSQFQWVCEKLSQDGAVSL